MNCPTHTDTELEFRSGTYPTGVSAPDGVQEMVYDEWYYCSKGRHGFSPEDLEKAGCPTCGCSGACMPAISAADRKLLNAIYEYFDDTGDGAPDSDSLARQNLNFAEPLHQLIKRLK